jgi:hypothetical protein
MAFTDWYVEGPSFGNCNCGYACPWQFEELPTNGTCDGFEVLEGCCQTNAHKSHFSSNLNPLGHAKTAPLGKSGGTVQLEI